MTNANAVAVVPLADAAFISIAGRVYPFHSVQEASRCYREAIDILGTGGSDTPPCSILDSRGRKVGYVSYNGRVWAERGGFPHDPLVFDPYEGKAAARLVW